MVAAFNLQAARGYRLANASKVQLAGRTVSLAAPARAKLPTKKSAPLLVVKGDDTLFASLVEMQRLMASTREIADGPALQVPADIADDALAAIIADAVARYNLDSKSVAITPDELPDMSAVDGAGDEAALAHLLMARWATDRVYGQEMAIMRKAPVRALTRLMRPLMGKIAARAAGTEADNCGMIMHSSAVDRDYEIFVSVPASYDPASSQMHPLLVVLDGNIMFAPARAIAKRLAAEGAFTDPIIVGVGVPRAEGATQFALRRLQEFSPASDAYDFKDDVAKSLAPIYALAGQHMHDGFGQAPGLHHFIVSELLPALNGALKIDQQKLALFGHSAGGTYVGFELYQPDSPFTGFLCSSPGLALTANWLWQQALPDYSAAPRRVVFGIGGAEFANDFNQVAGIPGTPDYAKRWIQTGDDVSLIEFEGETHSTVVARMLVAGLNKIWNSDA